MMNFITVHVGRINGVTKQVTLNPSATVADALSAAGMEAGNSHISINGTDAQASSIVRDGDLVMLAVGAKGA